MNELSKSDLPASDRTVFDASPGPDHESMAVSMDSPDNTGPALPASKIRSGAERLTLHTWTNLSLPPETMCSPSGVKLIVLESSGVTSRFFSEPVKLSK